MKKFNTTAVCISEKHYMVDLGERIKEIKKLVDNGEYFTINRARQYGKTTTLNVLRRFLLDEYAVLFLDFQGIGEAGFKTEERFVRELCRLIWNRRSLDQNIPTQILDVIHKWKDDKKLGIRLGELFDLLTDWCRQSEKAIVLIIDEVDSASNNQVFLDFLAQLREKYISRDMDGIPAFQSVILASVTDIKHLKRKIRQDGGEQVNSPWNIAADFDIDMSLPETGIQTMLEEYEKDHHAGMDTGQVAKLLYKYTNGYPYLVSKLCQIVDEKLCVKEPEIFTTLQDAWTPYGIDEAVKILLSEPYNTLFGSLTGKLTNYPELKKELRRILLRGEAGAWLPYDEQQQQLYMYGLIKNLHNTIAISNRIFEMLLYTHFIGETNLNDDLKQAASAEKRIFVEEDGWLDIPKIMEHFIKEHNRIHGENNIKFLEQEGRERFITYIAAIINGTGTYSIEEQTRDHRRMDLVIHYLGRRYIIELKIWHGERYLEKGEQQIIEYMDYFELTMGYMLSFNFNKIKQSGVERIQIGDKVLFEGIV